MNWEAELHGNDCRIVTLCGFVVEFHAARSCACAVCLSGVFCLLWGEADTRHTSSFGGHRMMSTVEKHEERAAKKDVPARERYKSRREDRKPGPEEIETMRTDALFTKRSDSAMAVRTCSLVIDPRLPESALFSQIR